MQLRFFQIPAYDGDEASDELNKFLRSHRVITVDRHFIPNGANSSWAICVSFVDGAIRSASNKRSKVDYRDVLSEADFTIYSKLRDLRKRLAAEEGFPVYALFTNEQLAEMARKRPGIMTDLTAIAGVGNARIDKHGEAFLAVFRAEPPALSDPELNGGETHGA